MTKSLQFFRYKTEVAKPDRENIAAIGQGLMGIR
jgi:hypothetical protein